MAKKRKGPNKSKAIREYAAANEGAGPSVVAAALKEQGIEVSPQFVSTIISNAKKSAGKKRGRKPRAANATNGATPAAAVSTKVAPETLLAAKKLADKLGGVHKAKAALDLLAQLLG